MKKMFKNLKTPKFKFGKKFMIGVALLAAVAVGGVFMYMNMQQKTMFNTALANVAEARFFMKTANAGGMDVQLYSGIRDENNTKVPFVMVNLNGTESLKDMHQIEASLKVGVESFPIVLLQNTYFPLTFANDIIKSIPKEIKPTDDIEITLMLETGNNPTLPLENSMPASAITWDEALRIAVDQCGDRLCKHDFETHVTILKAPAQDAEALWLVRFVCANNDIHSCVIGQDGSSIKH